MNTIQSGDLIVAINEEGAELTSLSYKGREYLWTGNKDVWPRQAPVLFPIVGKLKNNRYFYEGNEYELPQHGFARDMRFRQISASPYSCSFELKWDEETLKKYPFPFFFRITYTIQSNSIITEYAIHNPAAHPLLASAGAHPGFLCPLEPHEKFSDYYLEFERNELLQTPLENGLRSDGIMKLRLPEKRLALTDTLFDNDALVFENSQVETVSLRSVKSTRSITLQCKGWPYFGIWSKKGYSGFICLEPWHGIADRKNATGELNHKEGMLHLEGGKDFKCSFSLTLT
jgi:galactose mutarotase-like enzyme